MTAYLVYEVCTGRRFGGNQLAVSPDATGLAEARGLFTGTIPQGEDMGRPSHLGADTAPGRVTVSGPAVRVLEGRLP